MIQSFILTVLVILCLLLIVSLFMRPLGDKAKNPCRFKILPPKYTINGNKKYACFYIVVEKNHRYFINFPLLFKFYSDQKFRAKVKAFYTIAKENRQIILDKNIEFISQTKEYIIYITDIIVGKILIEVEIEIEEGSPIIGFEIMNNSTCEMMKEQKIEIRFPE